MLTQGDSLMKLHPSKLICIQCLSMLFQRVGNYAESKRLLTHALNLSRKQGDDRQLAQIFGGLAAVRLQMGLSEEVIQYAKEASENFGWLGGTAEKAMSFAQSFLIRNNQKMPHPARSISSQRMANNPCSAISNTPLALYINPRARSRRRFTILR